MELVNHFEQMDMAFLSFGTSHHDIALIKVPDDQPVGSSGLSHTALQIEGGQDELAELYQSLKAYGAKVEFMTDHGLTKSVYFFDPDGNRIEVFCEAMELAEGKKFLSEVTDTSVLRNELNLEPAAKS